MVSRDSFELVDLVTGGNLESILRDRRTGYGEGLQAIADYLRTKYEIRVSREMVRRWCDQLGIAKKGAQ